MDNTILTVPELARRWKVHTVTIYRLLERRELPAFKIGKAWRIALSTVLAYEQQNSLQNL